MERLERLTKQYDKDAAIKLLREATRHANIDLTLLACEVLLHHNIPSPLREITGISAELINSYYCSQWVPIWENDEHTLEVRHAIRKAIDHWRGMEPRAEAGYLNLVNMSNYLAWLTKLLPNPQLLQPKIVRCGLGNSGYPPSYGCGGKGYKYFESTGKVTCFKCKGTGKIDTGKKEPSPLHSLRMHVDALMLRSDWFGRFNEAAGYLEGEGSPRVPLPVNLLPGEHWTALVHQSGKVECGEACPILPKTEYYRDEINPLQRISS